MIHTILNMVKRNRAVSNMVLLFGEDFLLNRRSKR